MTTPTLPNLAEIEQMVQNIAAKNLVAVGPAFDAEMTAKIQERLAARKQEVAESLYSRPSNDDEVIDDPVIVSDDMEEEAISEATADGYTSKKINALHVAVHKDGKEIGRTHFNGGSWHAGTPNAATQHKTLQQSVNHIVKQHRAGTPVVNDKSLRNN